MDTRNRRTVHIMLLRAQRPICITGMGLTTVGVTTMAQGEKLINSVYFTPWDRMDTRNRRTVHIMLLRAQRPICITGMGLTTVGVTTMAQVWHYSLSKRLFDF
ncbi:7tm odorant receptor domain-containing protein [Phthorimaea operculella]|nr:7tm odorant receptor domain-containing protein [Phthorimaea operculella]